MKNAINSIQENLVRVLGTRKSIKISTLYLNKLLIVWLRCKGKKSNVYLVIDTILNSL